MNLDQLIGRLRTDRAFMDCVTEWRTLPATEGRYEPLPDDMDPRLCDVLRARGIHRLYCHQAECFRLAQEGRDFVVVTPTASGKTLCYNLPVVSAILKNNDARALYLFPTKALSADQVSGLYDMIEALGVDIKTYTYDGDTSGRRATSWSPTRTCCTPTFSPTIPDGSSCLKISNTSSSTSCTPTAACSEAIWPTCSAA